MEVTDEELVQATLAGRREAFDTLVERHARTVYRLCYRYAGRHEDASDLAQEVFLRAFRGLHGFKGRSAFTTWLHRVGVNVCLNHVSGKGPSAGQFEPLDAAPRIDGDAEDPAAALLRTEQAQRVRTAIAQLPAKQQATLVLRVYQELPHEEIARILGTSVGASKANLFHALAKLRVLLKP